MPASKSRLERGYARLLLSLLMVLPAAGGATGTEESEQGRIHQEQRVLDRELATELQDCRSRFAVSNCSEQAQRRHRSASKPLREQQLRLEDQERQHRASLRRATIADKARAAAASPAASAPPTDLRLRKPRQQLPGSVGAPAMLPAASAPSAESAAPTASGAAASRSDSRAGPRDERRETRHEADAAAAATRAHAARTRAAEGAATRARIAARQAARAADSKPAAAPLPAPEVRPGSSPAGNSL